MKKMFLTFALVATVLVSCNRTNKNSSKETLDSTTVEVDSTIIDTVSVSDAEAKDYLKDTVK